MKIEFFRQIFEKYSNIKFDENASSGIRVVSCGRTETHDEAVSRFSQFCGTRLRAINSPTFDLSLKDGFNWSHLRQTDKPGKPHTLWRIQCNVTRNPGVRHSTWPVLFIEMHLLTFYGLWRQCLSVSHLHTTIRSLYSSFNNTPSLLIKTAAFETHDAAVLRGVQRINTDDYLDSISRFLPWGRSVFCVKQHTQFYALFWRTSGFKEKQQKKKPIQANTVNWNIIKGPSCKYWHNADTRRADFGKHPFVLN
jgi:hypothetical protein